MEKGGWLGIIWTVIHKSENGPCWSRSEDFAVKAPLREAETGGAKLRELLIAKAGTI